MAEGPGRRRSARAVAKIYAALDASAAELERQNGRQYDTGFGGEVHQRYVEWQRANPEQVDEYRRTFRDVQSWDDAKKPALHKANGQGVLGFYDDDLHLAVDNLGGRVRFALATMEDMDAWSEVQKEEFESQRAASQQKRWFYKQIRQHLSGPQDTAGRVMRDVFGYRAQDSPSGRFRAAS